MKPNGIPFLALLSLLLLQSCQKAKLSSAQRRALARHVVACRLIEGFSSFQSDLDHELLQQYDFRASSNVAGAYTSTWGKASEKTTAVILVAEHIVDGKKALRMGYYVISAPHHRLFTLSSADDGTTNIGEVQTEKDFWELATPDAQTWHCRKHFLAATNNTTSVIYLDNW
jgi:hypothetical protein